MQQVPIPEVKTLGPASYLAKQLIRISLIACHQIFRSGFRVASSQKAGYIAYLGAFHITDGYDFLLSPWRMFLIWERMVLKVMTGVKGAGVLECWSVGVLEVVS